MAAGCILISILEPKMEIPFPNSEDTDKSSHREPEIHRVRLPGFIIEGEVGLGDLIRHATYSIGIKPCAACEHRAAKLNQWMSFYR
jgi:hypothetical protein